MKRFTALGAVFLSILLTACATSQSARAPGTDLHQLKSFYVARLPADERGIEKLISSRLNTLGYQCTSGDEATPASPVDAVVTYQDRWMWDITMYMIKLDIQIRDGHSGAILANGEVVRPSLQRKSPEGMVEETLGVIFK